MWERRSNEGKQGRGWAGEVTLDEAVVLLTEAGLPEATIRTLLAGGDGRTRDGGREAE